MSYTFKQTTSTDNQIVDDDDDDGNASSGVDTDSIGDWQSSLGEALHTKSLFSAQILPTPQEALNHDEKKHGISLKTECERLNLDLYGRMRFINWIRKETPSPSEVQAVTRDILDDETLLVPVIVDDPLLSCDFDDDWSDDEMLGDGLTSAKTTIAKLQQLVQTLTTEPEAGPSKRDDDTHYFGSYEENDIHEVMLRDTTRTVSYARFILSNPQLFVGATVMDVGCGTGILSMLAAKAGAKRVYAVEASGLAHKARTNVHNNSLSEIVTVIQGKVEEVEIEGEVDIIISEWMGYMLLYESMLDSVLVARDRFLAPGGLVVPSQTRLVLSAITADKIRKERIDFWHSVYGFDMTVMNSVYYDDGIVEIVDAEEAASNECIVKDVNAHTATVKSLDFASPFSLTCTGAPIYAFLTHFHTFFAPTPASVPESEPVDTTHIGDELESGVEPLEAKPEGRQVSFTTGSKGKPTHWKQVVFLLREPITPSAGDVICGVFHCRKSATNSRELDVEIHYQLKGDGIQTRVQTYRVK